MKVNSKLVGKRIRSFLLMTLSVFFLVLANSSAGPKGPNGEEEEEEVPVSSSSPLRRQIPRFGHQEEDAQEVAGGISQQSSTSRLASPSSPVSGNVGEPFLGLEDQISKLEGQISELRHQWDVSRYNRNENIKLLKEALKGVGEAYKWFVETQVPISGISGAPKASGDLKSAGQALVMLLNVGLHCELSEDPDYDEYAKLF